MSVHRLGRGGCEYLPHLKLLISYWPMADFLDEEWDAYGAELSRRLKTSPSLRVLTWNPLNATPRAEQQQRMAKVAAGTTHKVSIVMREKPEGFATSVLVFVNPNIGTFSENEWVSAWTHLELTVTDQREAHDALQRLRAVVDSTS